MHQLPKKVQPPSQFEKPAKQRLIEKADELFRLLGIRAAPSLIAQEAHTNMDTLAKYFGHGDSLVGRFIKTLIAECEDYWRSLAAEYPNDPEAQLRWWLAFEEDQDGYMIQPRVLLSRTAAELFEPRRQQQPLLREIEEYWQAERRRVVGLCRAAGLRDPLEARREAAFTGARRTQRTGCLRALNSEPPAAEHRTGAYGCARRFSQAPVSPRFGLRLGMTKPDDAAVVVFTSETRQEILAGGGSLGWVLSPKSVEHCLYLVCCRRQDWNNKAEGIPSRAAFLVGRISSLTAQEASENSRGQARFHIGISEFADIAVDEVWRKELRNPVAYAGLKQLGIQLKRLKFQPLPAARPAGSVMAGGGLTIAEAKQALAATFGVRPEDIEITIKG
ncbi:hypothetical protein ACVOMS_31760 [Bradyrhizobium guangxiense]